MKAITERNM